MVLIFTPSGSFDLFCFVLTRGEDSLLTSVYHGQATTSAHAPSGFLGNRVVSVTTHMRKQQIAAQRQHVGYL